MPFPSRRIRTAVLGSLLISTAGLGALVAAGAGAAPTQDLPDLTAMLPDARDGAPNARWVDTTEIAGRTLYRFDSVIFNNGPGAIEVARLSGTTYQRTWSGGIPGTTATNRPLALGGPGQQNALRYSAAIGHDHFHSQRIAAYELRTTSGAARRRPPSNNGCASAAAADQVSAGALKRSSSSRLAQPNRPVRLMRGKRSARATPTSAAAASRFASAARMSGRSSSTLGGQAGGQLRRGSGQFAARQHAPIDHLAR